MTYIIQIKKFDLIWKYKDYRSLFMIKDRKEYYADNE